MTCEGALVQMKLAGNPEGGFLLFQEIPGPLDTHPTYGVVVVIKSKVVSLGGNARDFHVRETRNPVALGPNSPGGTSVLRSLSWPLLFNSAVMYSITRKLL